MFESEIKEKNKIQVKIDELEKILKNMEGLKKMNSVNIIGRLVRDHNFNTTGSGKACLKNCIAVDGYTKNDTDFINIVAWEKTAEFINKYFSKGKKIAINGRIKTGSYEKDGKKVYTFDVIVGQVFFCESNNSNNTVTNNNNNNNQNVDIGYQDVGDEELPF